MAIETRIEEDKETKMEEDGDVGRISRIIKGQKKGAKLAAALMLPTLFTKCPFRIWIGTRTVAIVFHAFFSRSLHLP
jgi:hypothetical protein